MDEVLKQYSEIDTYSLYTSVCFAATIGPNGQSMQTSTKRSSKMVRTLLKKLNKCYVDIIENECNHWRVKHLRYVNSKEGIIKCVYELKEESK